LIRFRPTFKFFKDGKEVDSVRGADAASLEAKVKQHYVAPAAAESSGTGGMANSVNGYPDITSNIDIKNVNPPSTSLMIVGMFKSAGFASSS
jgi:hypothetical protein